MLRSDRSESDVSLAPVPSGNDFPDEGEETYPASWELAQALERVDLSLPQEYELEAMANEMLSHLAAYATASAAGRAARHLGDHRRAEELGRQAAFNRAAVAVMQYRYPKAKAMADEIADLQARRARKNRQAALKDLAEGQP